IDEQEHGERGLEQLREILRGYPGTKTLKLRLDLASGEKVLLDSGRRVDVNAEMRDRVQALLGPGCMSTQSARPKPRPPTGTGTSRFGREPARTESSRQRLTPTAVWKSRLREIELGLSSFAP